MPLLSMATVFTVTTTKMLYSKVLAILALTLGASATPLAGRPFKFGVTFDNARTVYLTETGEATESADRAMTCTLNSDSIACGSVQGSFSFNEMHPFSGALKPSASASQNRGWSIAEDGAITWSPDGSTVAFSRAVNDKAAKKVYAEACSILGHLDASQFVPGVAKAYYV